VDAGEPGGAERDRDTIAPARDECDERSELAELEPRTRANELEPRTRANDWSRARARTSVRTRLTSSCSASRSSAGPHSPGHLIYDVGMCRLLAGVFVLTACGDVIKTTADSGVTVSDTASDDAGTWLPTVPPVTNGQAADLAVDQTDLVARTPGTAADKTMSSGGLCAAGEYLWISDFALSRSRVLQYNAPPTVFSSNADIVLGQPTATSTDEGPTRSVFAVGSFSDGSGDVACDGERVVVSDMTANRVLIYNAIPNTNGPTWDVVLGQTTATGATAETSASGLRSPQGVWTDGQRLIVADTGNHRVLIWNTFPTTNKAPADVVLGQTSFNVAENPSPPTASSMNQPRDVFFDGERLYVSDSMNHRVMGWNGIPTQNNQPADFFVGQSGGASGTANAGAGSQSPNAVGLQVPGEITVAHGSLFITDMVNFRIVVHTPRPTTSGEAADAVLGNTDLMGGEVASEHQLWPRGLVVQGDKLFVSDSSLPIGQSRVLRYQLSNISPDT